MVPGYPFGNLYSGLGYVWETGLLALPKSMRARAPSLVSIPVTPSQAIDNAWVVAFGAGSVWVIDEHAPEYGGFPLGVLYRIDPTTHAITAQIPIPSPSTQDFFELTYGAHTLWVADGQQGILRAVSPQSDTITETLKVGYVDSIAAGNGSLWIANAKTTLTQLTLNGHTRWHTTLPTHQLSINLDGPRLELTYGQTHPRGLLPTYR